MVEQRERLGRAFADEEVDRVVEIADEPGAQHQVSFRIRLRRHLLAQLRILHDVVLAALLAHHADAFVRSVLRHALIAGVVALLHEQTEHHGVRNAHDRVVHAVDLHEAHAVLLHVRDHARLALDAVNGRVAAMQRHEQSAVAVGSRGDLRMREEKEERNLEGAGENDVAVVVDAGKRALAEEDDLAGRETEVVVLLIEWVKETSECASDGWEGGVKKSLNGLKKRINKFQ